MPEIKPDIETFAKIKIDSFSKKIKKFLKTFGGN